MVCYVVTVGDMVDMVGDMVDTFGSFHDTVAWLVKGLATQLVKRLTMGDTVDTDGDMG